MSYVICAQPGIRIDILVKKEYWPKLIGHIQRCECTYRSEKEIDIDGDAWIKVNDIQADRGYKMGAFLGLFYGLEWDSLTGKVGGPEHKFYILIKQRRKKHVRKDRKEADSGSKGGDRGKPANHSGSGPVDESAGDGTDAGVAGGNNPWIPQE